MKKIFFSILIIATAVSASAQDKTKTSKQERREQRKERIDAIAKLEEEGVIKYKKQFAGGVKLTSDGYGGFLEWARPQSVKKSLLYQFEITERKHPKESKQFNNNTGAGPYIYGKINFFYPVKLGVQQQFLLGNKGNKNGVSLSANVGGGVTLGLLRPYLLGYDSAGTRIFRGLADDSARFLFDDPISGPNLTTGFSKLKVTPGAYVKSGLRFDYGKYNEMVSAVEVGVMLEYYTKAIPQMAFNKDEKVFFSAYVAILFGKRK
ncbi:hypothetical protein ACFOWM_01405 [Ferruginibacter yonginensis]|uniref:Outer membrane protein beta-barrel domain-containing protein n=1 Tax=Ferruginibacter yonginensis TaxID=1310416 RepID=A0ABV8QP31_9BACT